LTVDRTQPGLTLTKTLDDFGRVMDFNWTNGSGSIVRYEYGYDANSNVLYKEDLVNGGLSELYGYDALNQIASMARGTLNGCTTAITGTPDFEQSWNHDSLGNWDDVTTNGVVEDRESNAQNEYTTANGNSPAYDANGNMTTDQTGRHFVWDAWNRLVEVQNSSSTTLVTYSYDSLNRRVTSDDGTTVTNLYYSVGWQVLQEQVAGNVTQQYVYSATYPDAMILRDRDTDNDGIVDERLWVIQDNNFNVMALVDDTGVVVERYKYTAFGVATIMDASYNVIGTSAYAWVHLHQGLRLEEASGLYDNRFRWYSATLGQFVSNDPIGFNAGDVNLRRYVGNGPVGSVDPSGLENLVSYWTQRIDSHNSTIEQLASRLDSVNYEIRLIHADRALSCDGTSPGLVNLGSLYREQQSLVNRIGYLRSEIDQLRLQIAKAEEATRAFNAKLDQTIEKNACEAEEARLLMRRNQRLIEQGHARERASTASRPALGQNYTLIERLTPDYWTANVGFNVGGAGFGGVVSIDREFNLYGGWSFGQSGPARARLNANASIGPVYFWNRPASEDDLKNAISGSAMDINAIFGAGPVIGQTSSGLYYYGAAIGIPSVGYNVETVSPVRLR